mgnify:FL=1
MFRMEIFTSQKKEWKDLPFSEEELEKLVMEDKYYLNDYENDFGIDFRENDNLAEINEIATWLESLNEDKKEKLVSVLKEGEIDSCDPSLSEMQNAI